MLEEQKAQMFQLTSSLRDFFQMYIWDMKRNVRMWKELFYPNTQLWIDPKMNREQTIDWLEVDIRPMY
jgi:hypothetical protein